MINDNKVNEFINQGFKEIDKEVQQEYDIRDQAEYLARMLAINPVVKATVMDRVYALAMKMVKLHTGEQVIILVAEDEIKKQVYGNKYSPAILQAEFNDNFTLEENCQTLLSAFIGKVTGNFKIETLEDEGTVKVAREKDFNK